MRSPKSGQSLKAQDGLKVPKKAKNTVRRNGAAGNTVQKKPQNAKFIRRKRAGSQAVLQEAVLQEAVLQEAGINRPVKNRCAGAGKADVALIKDNKRHSDLAMRAAKRIKGSKNKRKTSHLVCHHLRMMLSSPEAQPRTTYYYPPAYTRRAVAVNERVGQHFLPI
jgi:hypothetical protein